jgi:hypothetical protein
MSGDTGLEDGADFILNSGWDAWGSGVEHISQVKREGWFRKVQAEHAMLAGISF